MKSLLIPVFTTTFHGTDKNLNEPFGKAKIDIYAEFALYSYQTWKRNTDASEHNVRCQIYLEERLTQRLTPYFLDNGLTEADIKIFDTGQDNWARLTKFAYPLWDEQLKNHEHIFLSDADLYVPPKMNFFERYFGFIQDHPNAMLFLRAYDKTNAEMADTARGRLLEYLQKGTKAPAAHVLRRALDTYTEITGEHRLLREFTAPDARLMWNSSGIWTYPAKHYHDQQPKMIEWLKRCAHTLGNDEVVATIAHRLFGFEARCIRTELEIRYRYSNPETSKDDFIHGDTILHGKEGIWK